MSPLHIVIPGHPRPKARHRATIRNGKVHTYKAAVTREYEARVREAVGRAAALVQWSPLHGPVEVRMHIWFKDRRHADLSNVQKAIEDAMNRIAYVDDKQIQQGWQRYDFDADRPRAEVWVRPLDEEPNE